MGLRRIAIIPKGQREKFREERVNKIVILKRERVYVYFITFMRITILFKIVNFIYCLFVTWP